jgi:lysophospholipase L1-like esterase
MKSSIRQYLKSLFFGCAFLFSLSVLHAQSDCPPFWKDIQAFKKADSAQQPAKNAILFVGSSSFTNWKDVQDYFPGYTIINRGFGGSQLTDVIRYAYDIVLPYAPKQVVIYCGENDLAAATMTAEEVVLRFKTLFGMIRQNLPKATIDFISLKPSPSRQSRFAEFRKANAQIKAFLAKQSNTAFIDVFTAMLDKNGQPKAGIFLEDKLHMKPEGYRIWQSIIQPYLKK